ncbi:hypothetical protein JTB14_031939 [Gonioctena quinquepunctata]|nr:hypothetical protein JTB14_031939 [Gonioctena quinquepunctata]
MGLGSLEGKHTESPGSMRTKSSEGDRTGFKITCLHSNVLFSRAAAAGARHFLFPHAFTGCNTNSVAFRSSKVKFVKLSIKEAA